MDLTSLPGQFFGTELRRLREHHRWTQSALAERIGFSDAMVGYIENAHRIATERFAAACDTAFDTGTYLSRLCGMARRFGAPRAPLRDLLRAATTLRLSDPLLVPALVQTDDYARAAMTAHCLPDEQADELMATRARLADLLDATAELRAWLVIDETTLYRPLGGRQAHRAQLKELLSLADTRRVVVQVLKTTSPTLPLLRVPRQLLSFPDGTGAAHLPDHASEDGDERYGDPDRHAHAFDLLRAAALPPGVSRGRIAEACR